MSLILFSTLFYSKIDAAKGAKKKLIFKIPQEIQLNKPSTSKIYDVAVIGGGAAGSMAAYKSVFQNDDVLFIVGGIKNIKQASGMWVPKLGNIPALESIKKPIVSMRNEIIKLISDSGQKEKLAVLEKSIDYLSKRTTEDGKETFILKDSDGNEYKARFVILATGMMSTQPSIGGSIKPIFPFANTQQAVYCLRCDGHLAVSKKNVVIIGYSNDAASNAILLAERYGIANVTILTNGNETNFDDENKSLIKRYGIKVNLNPITKISNPEKKKLEKIYFSNNTEIDVDFIVVSLGVRICNSLANQLKADLDPGGYVIGDYNGLTSIKNLYVAGDLKANSRKQVYVAWDSAIRASEAINREIRSQKRDKSKN